MIFTKICDAVKTYHLWSASSLQWWWSSSSSKEVEMTSLSISKRQQSFNVYPRWVNVREHRDSIVGCMRWEVRTLMSVAAVYCRWVNVRVHPLRLVVVPASLRRLEKAPDLRLPLLRDPVRVRVGNWKVQMLLATQQAVPGIQLIFSGRYTTWHGGGLNHSHAKECSSQSR